MNGMKLILEMYEFYERNTRNEWIVWNEYKKWMNWILEMYELTEMNTRNEWNEY